MRHRTQLYLDEDQHRWLKARAGRGGSIAAVVRDLIDSERGRRPPDGEDILVRFLLERPAASDGPTTSVGTLDRDIYGEAACAPPDAAPPDVAPPDAALPDAALPDAAPAGGPRGD